MQCFPPVEKSVSHQQPGTGVHALLDVWFHTTANWVQLGNLLKGAPAPHSPSPICLLVPAHITSCSQKLQGWPVSSSDRWWIRPCIGSVIWSNAPFVRKIWNWCTSYACMCARAAVISGSTSGTWQMKRLAILFQPRQPHVSAGSLRSALKICGAREILLRVVTMKCNFHLFRSSTKGLRHTHQLDAKEG